MNWRSHKISLCDIHPKQKISRRLSVIEILNKEDYGWSDFVSKDVLVHSIQANHLTLLEPENVVLIANYIEEGSLEVENEITPIS